MPDTTQYTYGVTTPLEPTGYLVTRTAPGERSPAVAVATCSSQLIATQIVAALTATQPTVAEIEEAHANGASRPLVRRPVLPRPAMDELSRDVLADFIAGALGDINSRPMTAGELADALVSEGWVSA